MRIILNTILDLKDDQLFDLYFAIGKILLIGNLTVDMCNLENLVNFEEQSSFYFKSYVSFSVIRGGKYRNWCQKVNCKKFHRKGVE